MLLVWLQPPVITLSHATSGFDAFAIKPNRETYPLPAPPNIIAFINIPIDPAIIKGIIVPNESRIAAKCLWLPNLAIFGIHLVLNHVLKSWLEPELELGFFNFNFNDFIFYY